MADLYQAYALESDNHGGGGFFDEKEEVSYQQPQQQPRRQSEGFTNANQAQPVPQKVVKEEFQNSPPYELKNYEKQEPPRRNISYSFWDRMAIKRPEVIKLGVFALVIVLAISLERIGTHYLTRYLSDNIFTDLQDLMLRFSYPIGIFLLIWIVKSL